MTGGERRIRGDPLTVIPTAVEESLASSLSTGVPEVSDVSTSLDMTGPMVKTPQRLL